MYSGRNEEETMAEFTLKRVEQKTLKVNIGEESYQIPLMGSLTFKEAKTLDTQEGTYAFIKRYIPGKILDDLKVEEYNQIVNIWKEESQKHSGKSQGES